MSRTSSSHAALVGIPLAFLALLVVVGLTATACAPRPDPAAEEAAVLAVLEAESRLAVAGELDSLLSLYVQDDKQARLSVTRSVSALITGWDAVRRHQEDLLASDWMDWLDKRFEKENVLVKVAGDQAWAVNDNVWRWREEEGGRRFQNIQITILEKHRGRWLISFQAFVRDPEHPDVIDTP